MHPEVGDDAPTLRHESDAMGATSGRGGLNACGPIRIDPPRSTESPKMVFTTVILPTQLRLINATRSPGSTLLLKTYNTSYAAPQNHLVESEQCAHAALPG